jgi:hypothetical protein
MALSVRVAPSSSSIDMYDDPDTSSAYSLSGDVILSLENQWSFLGQRKPTRVVISSITMTFEGQCEIVSPQHGYRATRLCSITQELCGSEPVELVNELDEGDNINWSVVFNLPIPGWLPATTSLGYDNEFGVKYGVYVDVSYYPLYDERSQGSGWSCLSLCYPFLSRNRTAAAGVEIPLRRFMPTCHVPEGRPYSTSPLPPFSSEGVSAVDDILAKLRVHATVPNHVSVEDTSFPCSLRLCGTKLTSPDRQKLKVALLSIQIYQTEKCRGSPPSDYRVMFPLPHDSLQPPVAPLRNPHRLSIMVDIGMDSIPITNAPSKRTISLLPPGVSGHAFLQEDLTFQEDEAGTDFCFLFETNVPFTSVSTTKTKSDEWAGKPVLRPTTSMPLYVVKHELEVAMLCKYDLHGDGSSKVERWVRFSIPVKFGVPEPAVAPANLALREDEEDEESDNDTAPLLGLGMKQPQPVSLPAYSQLFHPNGDRRIDYTIPLPVYSLNDPEIVDCVQPLPKPSS